MQKHILILLFFGNCLVVSAQQQEVLDIPLDAFQRPGRLPGIYGKIVEGDNNKGVQAATVEVFVKRLNKSNGIAEDSLITGMMTKANGDFGFNNISLPGFFFCKDNCCRFHRELKNDQNKSG